MAAATLEIEDLSIAIDGRKVSRLVVDRVSLTVAPGEIVAVIGESGSGKTLTALAVLGLLPRQARLAGGAIRLGGIDVAALTRDRRRRLLGDRIAFMPQDALRALNPTLPIADQVGEPFVDTPRICLGRRPPAVGGSAARRPSRPTPRSAPGNIRTSFPAACSSAP